MKKITTLFFLLLAALSYAQTPCAPVSNPLPAGFGQTDASLLTPTIISNDLVVNANENFTLERITANLFSGTPISVVNVTYYDDNGGLPGTIIGSQNNVVPTSEVFAGSTREVTLDVTPFQFMGQIGVPTTYWIGLSFNNTASAPLLNMILTSSSTTGNFVARSINSQPWTLISGFDGVGSFSGTCSLIGPQVTIMNAPASTDVPFTVDFVFDVPVTGFTIGDISISNAIPSNFVVNSATSYSALITPISYCVIDVNIDVPTNAAQDASNGNPSNAAQQVTVSTFESISPNVITQNVTVILDSFGQATLLAMSVDGGTTDNCGIASLTVSPSMFTCNDIGTNTVALTATDTSGNTSNAFASVNVLDQSSPSAIAQNFTAQLDASGQVTISPSDIDGGSTDNCGIASSSLSATSFDCNDIGATQVTLTITDTSGNTDTATAFVTVADVTPPTVLTQGINVQLNAQNQANISVSDINNGSTDNCSIASLSLDILNFDCSNLGANTVTLTATDTSGNSASQTAIVNVSDNTTPVAIAQNITVDLDSNGQVLITPQDIDNGSSDNCGITGSSLDITSFDCNDIGVNQVILTVTDGSGNTSSTLANVTVQDVDAPNVITQNISVILGAGNTVAIVPADVDNGSFDNCAIVSLTLDINTFDCNNLGTNTVTLTATDSSGNSASQTATVTVSETTAPIVITQNITLPLSFSGLAFITAADIDNGTTDNCAIASLSLDITNFNCSNIGANTVILTAVDTSGNTASASATVTVVDNLIPFATCQDITVQLDANGIASITGADVDNFSFDNCGIASSTVTPSTFNCDDIGTNTVVLTIFDSTGNSSSCTAQVTVEDVTPPIALCQDITVQLDASGQAIIAVSDIDGGTTDNCLLSGITISQSSFTCADIGANSVILSATDINGNSASCTAKVTVVDSIAPTLSCPMDVTVGNDPGVCGATVFFPNAIALDNCSTTVSQTNGLPTGSLFPLGINTIEFTATDSGGNTTTCSFTITVEDTEAPVVICQDITVQLDANGNVSINASDINNGSTDNCGTIASLSIDIGTFNCSNLGDNNVTLMATDTAGNIGMCTATVTIEDNTAPVAVCQNITVQLDANGLVTLDGSLLDGGSTDACGIDQLAYTVDPPMLDCSNIGDNTVTLTVSDTSGNTSTCTTTVTVEDNVAPDLFCMDITVSLDNDGLATITSTDVISTIDDACGILSTSVDIFQFDCNDIGSPVTVQVFASDINGNLSSCTATVTVEDNLEPTITCPTNQTVAPASAGGDYTLPDYWANGEATVTDNCTDPVTTFTQTPAAGTPLPDGTYTITLTATDDSGNTASCDFELTVDSALGTEDVSLSMGSISLYPNPVKNTVHIANPQSLKLHEMKIYDLMGRLIQTTQLHNMGVQKSLDVNHLASATYIVIISGNDGQIAQKLIKE